jgi:hypothetical protein
VISIRLLLLASLVAAPPRIAAQPAATTRDTARVLVLEHRFGPDSAAPAVVDLRYRVVYVAVVSGPGTLVVEPVRPKGRGAFVSPEQPSAAAVERAFEVDPLESGPHRVLLQGLPAGDVATVRLYRDVAQTEHLAARRTATLSFGFRLGAGVHTGYRLDSLRGANPAAASDVEACFLAQVGDRFGTCLGAARQSLPEAGTFVTWLVAQEEVRIVSAHFFGRPRTDFGASLRYAMSLPPLSLGLNPTLWSGGLYVEQHFGVEGRWGWGAYAAWQHARVDGVPATTRLDSDRFVIGLSWVQ